MNPDEMILAAACEGINGLKRARTLAVEGNPSFTALDSKIDELEEWASLWASESENEEVCIKILDAQQIEHRPYA